jgi:hypothetical protein
MKNIYLILIYFALVSCELSTDRDYSNIELSEIKQVSNDLDIDKITLLESTNPNLLGTFLDVKFNQDYFWVLDLDNRDAVHGFNSFGKYIGYTGEVGEGPNHIPNISDFQFSEDEITTLSTFGDQIQISKFTYGNRLINKKRVPFNCFSFTRNQNGSFWLYSGYNLIAGNYRLKLISEEGGLQKEFFENDFVENMLPLTEPSFFSGENEILFRETLKPIIFSLGDSGPREKYRFDFGSLQVPDDFWEMDDPFKGFEMINKRGFANINFIYETKTHLLVDVLIQNESGVKKEIVILNKVKNEWIKIKVDEENIGYFYTPIGLTGDQIIFISYAPYVIRNLEKLTLSTAAKNSLKSLTEESNPVILYAKIPD